MQFFRFNQFIGSSLTFSVQGGRGKEKNAAAKNSVRPRKNTAEGGCGGNSAVFLQKTEASLAALLVQSRATQKNFLFLLEEKIGRAQMKSREIFFAGGPGVEPGLRDSESRFLPIRRPANIYTNFLKFIKFLNSKTSFFFLSLTEFSLLSGWKPSLTKALSTSFNKLKFLFEN